jgi:hypothetical protein
MILKKFNPQGVAAFIQFRDSLKANPALDIPVNLLNDSSLVINISPSIDFDEKTTFKSRLDLGKFLLNLLNQTNLTLIEKDQGLWAWLTLALFDQVCPKDSSGNRNVMAVERLVPLVDNSQKFYRHLLLGPYLIVRAHSDNPERAIALLINPPTTPGEIVAQLASRKELITNKGIIELSKKLYYDEANSKLKRGSGSSVKGAPRRLAAFLNQIDLTFYLYGMSGDQILQLLPKEFNRFI